MNSAPLITENLHKAFEGRTALRSLTLSLPAGGVTGLLGRNGSGKTTLLNLACGLLLPTSGTCRTLGRPAGELDAPELSRLGVVFQEGRYLDWMTVRQHLDFTASFYPAWDRARERRLLDELELAESPRLVTLSPGDRQKFGILLGVCHRPSLLLLDEPMSALDPIVRQRLLAFLMDMVREEGCSVVISSHILADVEKIIDWVVCLDHGDLALSAPFDEVQETYAEWIVTSHTDRLPVRCAEPWVLSQTGNARQARLSVRRPDAAAQAHFAAIYDAEIETRPLNLEQLFPLLINERRPAA